MGRVYAIASAKGGVGKTTTTANLGATLAETGADVVVIDGDIGMANLGAALGVEPTGPTLHDVLAGEAEPREAAYEGPAGLTVVPGDTSLDSFAAAEPQRLDRVVEAFDDAEFVLIDVGAGVSHETSIPLSVSDAVVLVSTPERDALVDTEKTRQLTERLGGVVAGAVITRTNEATPIEEVVSGSLTATVLTTIPDDEAVRESTAVGEPLVSYAPHSEAAAGYRELARQLTGRTPEPPEQPTEKGTETRERLEARDQQLSDSLSEGGVTMEPADDQPVDDAADQPETAPDSREAAAGDRAVEADHNVVNPFAASDEHPDADHPEQHTPHTERASEQPAPEAESKWADAATGTAIEESATPETADPEATESADTVDSEAAETPDTVDDKTAETPDTVDDESVPEEAIPFGDSDGGSEETVLGEALDDEPTANPEADTDDEPLIPDAEGEKTAQADTEREPVDDAAEDAEISVDDPDEDEDDDESRGFFSRLFG